MAPIEPPSALAHRRLPLLKLSGRLFRISHRKFPNPIYWSRKGIYRFDFPEAKYGVLYTGRTFETALLEVFGDQWIESRLAAQDFLSEFDVYEIALNVPLKVVNLSGKQLNLLSTDSNVFATLSYDATRKWATTFMEHPDAPDGIKYPSRKNQQLQNFALFQTAVTTASVAVARQYPLLDHPHLFRLLHKYRVALI